jgi:hypothetical protein
MRRRERATPFSGAIRGQKCLLSRLEEFTIFKLRLPDRARGAAENPCGFYCSEEDSLIISIFFY